VNVGVLTSLYPGPPRPHEGIFAERRWTGMRARGHGIRIVHPLPRAPGPLARGAWREIQEMPRREVRSGIPVARPRYLHLPGRALGNARRFARTGVRTLLAGAGTPDVVMCDYAWPAAAAVPLLCGIPCVVNGRGSDVLQVAGEAELADELAHCLRAAGHWCAVSRDLVRAMDALAGEARGVLVPNGVDLDAFAPGDRAGARAALELPAQGPLVLVVGHLIERKDPLLALEAFAAGAPADARCVLLGRGPLEGAVRERAARTDLAGRVELRGEVPAAALARWYAACDVLLLTSRREGRPNVVLEALAAGRPVVATEAGGTGELLAGLSGCGLTDDRRPAAIGRLLADVLAGPAAPEELRASVQELSWDAGLDVLEGLLERAAGAGAGLR
jgi:glycosyltransferase involved in cell wall biosynthesis